MTQSYFNYQKNIIKLWIIFLLLTSVMKNNPKASNRFYLISYICCLNSKENCPHQRLLYKQKKLSISKLKWLMASDVNERTKSNLENTHNFSFAFPVRSLLPLTAYTLIPFLLFLSTLCHFYFLLWIVLESKCSRKEVKN